MFWKTDEPHGLPRNPFKSCVVPRPIGWISTISPSGVPNLAPYSYFNAVSHLPPIVMFSGGARSVDEPKDSVFNAERTGEFVCSMVTYDLRDVMNETSADVPPDVDEAVYAGIEMEPSELVAPMRVKDAPIHLECTYMTTLVLPSEGEGAGNAVCFGRVVGVHINDEVLVDGFVDIARIRPLARLGYLDYTSVQEIFTIGRPKSRKDAAE